MSDVIARAQALVTDSEVITKAKLRKVTLAGDAGVMGLITLDNGFDHTKPNTFGPGSLVELNTAIDAALADDEITSIGVTGKPFILAAGADLTALRKAGSADDIRTIAELGHFVFGKLDSAVGGKKSFGFINGLALGGGLEVALNCDYRTSIDSLPAAGLPEVMLGLVPGWGGAWLVPNLIGAAGAVKVALENPLNQGKVLKGTELFEAGLSDASFGGADFLEQSLVWAGKVLTGEITVERPEVDRGQAWDDAVAWGRAVAAGKTGGKSVAATRLLDLVEAAKTNTKAEGFALEDQALVDMAQTPELDASLYSFDLVQKRAKRPAGAPDKALARKVTKVGIIGAGLMASQFALLFARRLKVPVVMTDLDQARADKGVAYVHGEIDKLAAKGRVTSDMANRLKALVTAEVDYEKAFSDADFIIEAVFEEMGVKKTVFANAEKVAPAEAVFATNTSSLSITEMAADLEHPERVVGFHFFNPVAIMPLVEIITGEKTSQEALATAFATSKGLGKTSILVKDSPSFIVNRLLGRFMGTVAQIVDEGTPVKDGDAAFAGLTPMPPFVLLGLVGPAIALHNNETLHRAFPDRMYVSPTLQRVVEAKLPGFYGADGNIAPEVDALLEKPANPVVKTVDETRTAVLEAMADEINRMLEEGVASAPEDIDLAMITGAGFQFWNGGITKLLDREGISEKVTGKKFHA